jgi:hypothetical protein
MHFVVKPSKSSSLPYSETSTWAGVAHVWQKPNITFCSPLFPFIHFITEVWCYSCWFLYLHIRKWNQVLICYVTITDSRSDCNFIRTKFTLCMCVEFGLKNFYSLWTILLSKWLIFTIRNSYENVHDFFTYSYYISDSLYDNFKNNLFMHGVHRSCFSSSYLNPNFERLYLKHSNVKFIQEQVIKFQTGSGGKALLFFKPRG